MVRVERQQILRWFQGLWKQDFFLLSGGSGEEFRKKKNPPTKGLVASQSNRDSQCTSRAVTNLFIPSIHQPFSWAQVFCLMLPNNLGNIHLQVRTSTTEAALNEKNNQLNQCWSSKIPKHSWYPKRPLYKRLAISWMMNQTFTNGKWLEITKHPFKTGFLGFQAYLSHEELTKIPIQSCCLVNGKSCGQITTWDKNQNPV